MVQKLCTSGAPAALSLWCHYSVQGAHTKEYQQITAFQYRLWVSKDINKNNKEEELKTK